MQKNKENKQMKGMRREQMQSAFLGWASAGFLAHALIFFLVSDGRGANTGATKEKTQKSSWDGESL